MPSLKKRKHLTIIKLEGGDYYWVTHSKPNSEQLNNKLSNIKKYTGKGYEVYPKGSVTYASLTLIKPL